jgi:hypothetical protein
MADDTLYVPPKSTRIQTIKVENFLKLVPADKRGLAYATLAEILLSATNSAVRPSQTQLDDPGVALLICGSFMPLGISDRATGPVLDAMRQVEMLYAERPTRGEDQPPPSTQHPQAQMVVTADYAEKKRKYIEFALGHEVWRNVQQPNQWLYAHIWLQKLQQGITRSQVKAEWKEQRESFFRANQVLLASSRDAPRFVRFILLIEYWLDTVAITDGAGKPLLLETQSAAEQKNDEGRELVPLATYRNWYNTIECILELMLLQMKLKTTFTDATQKFWSEVDMLWSKSSQIDYLKVIDLVKAEKK